MIDKDSILKAYQAGRLTTAEAAEKLLALQNQTSALKPPSASVDPNVVSEQVDDSVIKAESAIPTTTSSIKLPLSKGQKGLWLLQKLTPEMSAYNTPFALRFRQKLDPELWHKACRKLVAHYPILQTVIQEEGGRPVQVIDPTQPLWFELEDIAHLPQADLIPYLKTKAKAPFNLESGPLLRVQLFIRSEAEYILLVTIHHIIVDGTSMVHLLRTLLQIYQALTEESEYTLTTVEASYHDFVLWEQELLAGEAGRRQRAYWQQQLSGELPLLALPLDKPRPPIQRFKGETYSTQLEPDLTRKVRDLAKSHRMNLSLVFLGIFKLLLHRYTGQADLLIGTPTAGRPQRRFEETIGYFVNMVVLRSRLDETGSFLDYLKQLQLIVVDALDHGAYPFPQLVADLGLKPDPAISPLFQVGFAFQNFIRAKDLWVFADQGQENVPFEL
ncbi:MAG: hypothetical protein KDJ65_30655, partial [Anaerolineae bacterium]|nr:hypothetical protein [Anaerolineae bacterium]